MAIKESTPNPAPAPPHRARSDADGNGRDGELEALADECSRLAQELRKLAKGDEAGRERLYQQVLELSQRLVDVDESDRGPLRSAIDTLLERLGPLSALIERRQGGA